MEKDIFDIGVVGHFAIDYISLPSAIKPSKILGGAVAYVSLVTRILGGTVSVISKVGLDFPKNWFSKLQQKGIDLSCVTLAQGEQTTSYVLKYNEDLSCRALKLKNQGSQVTLSDLPASFNAKAIHIAPIAAEIPCEVIERLKTFTHCLSIDPQGMTRRFDENGNVTSSSKMDKKILSLINIYKSSLDEITILTGKTDVKQAIKVVHDLGPETVIVTLGGKGSILSAEGAQYAVPACKPKHVVDPTGAGDVFIGAFLTENTHKKDNLWCACVGSAAASLIVEGIGTSFFGNKEEIYRRANSIYEKEIKH